MIATRIGLAVAGLLAFLAGCSSDNPVIPNVFIASTVGPNPGDPMGQAKCLLGSELQWVNIGSEVDSVQDSNTFNGAPVTVNCSVVQTQPHNYAVTVSTTLGGQGSVDILNATMNDNTTALQMNVAGKFERGDTGSFSESDCTFDFNGQAGGPSNPNMGIGPGKIWGDLTCPNMQLQDSPTRFCEGRAELKFQNCSQ